MSKALEAARVAVQTEIGAYVLTDAMANRIARAAIGAYLRAVAEDDEAFSAFVAELARSCSVCSEPTTARLTGYGHRWIARAALRELEPPHD